jgi:hypothetical protein
LILKHIRRSNRTGYKAGALKEGLLSQRRIYCYFDADFVPQKTGSIKPFLILGSKIGVVQTRWGHLNRNYSVLKKFRLLL